MIRLPFFILYPYFSRPRYQCWHLGKCGPSTCRARSESSLVFIILLNRLIMIFYFCSVDVAVRTHWRLYAPLCQIIIYFVPWCCFSRIYVAIFLGLYLSKLSDTPALHWSSTIPRYLILFSGTIVTYTKVHMCYVAHSSKDNFLWFFLSQFQLVLLEPIV